ncbi:isoquinoline biosynthesis protein [Actinomadura sp. CNU-125]|uniref:FAD-dependent oxidoreductase n=1 Tax=Actinomadura sp. CNU-125 TaxID=1904961 RepID=UPI000960DE23|nr:BBE domain-containing protein [Actinomadura sp. CNU-125]OLT38167.1 isoquinoline biosynthesis protein [Actinomadura sp. CNU-125]
MSTPQLPPVVTVKPTDVRYPALRRGFNQRWLARPEYVRLVSTPQAVVTALSEAVNQEPDDVSRDRVTVRSGGHCYEDFVCGDDVRVILDVSPMCDMYFDPALEAWCVEAGATNWHGYSHLYPMSGRALPGGSCYSVGLGGHITGGGYGLLSRQAGLTVDYLYAVEVAVVTEARTVELVVATRDDPDPERRDLWWAHTGGGGGNFGVVTRFWFRDLPVPPRKVLLTARSWNWADVTRESFTRLLNAYGTWFADHQDPDTASGRLFALLALNHRAAGTINLTVQVDAESDDASDEGTAALLNFLEAVDPQSGPKSRPMTHSIAEHAAVPDAWTPRLMPWLTATQALNGSGPNRSGKYKSAYVRTPFTRPQIEAMWGYLGNNDQTRHLTNKEALIQIDSYGSAVNTPPRSATACPQRDSIMKMQYQVYWNRPSDDDPGHEAESLKWIRDTYRATFADTGGVPIVGGNTDGCYINYPDVDLDDSDWNTSGQPSSQLYYQDAYPRLQRVKARWDPLNVFRNAQSIEPSSGT